VKTKEETVSTDPSQVKGFQILQELAVRALDDPEFRRKLIDHPNEELARAGLKIPEGVRVIIHENTEHELHLVLPSCPPLHSNEVNVVHLFCTHHVF
jgi:hypothetical protein